ncbi:hypothetical protein FPZ43_15785 [Mucilaginibacter pallidiroseus]|uniref:Uncharacterized protein n=1 Tax=Mucilaginibacter pallidiroseus TaxID=2599295 RepID=A0A563U316_9SPHI|nr:hypothetical protein [Mucilaginibacter pallidiroseus]TWR25746.1 hypothetical protein FPZ43_15785 [Mucilaginibacter pallidiroseus]
MHIVYNAFKSPGKFKSRQKEDSQLKQRLEAYQAACQKHSDTLAAIQKYLPGWMPAFNINQ